MVLLLFNIPADRFGIHIVVGHGLIPLAVIDIGKAVGGLIYLICFGIVGKDLSSSGVSNGRSIIWSDCDGSFLLRLTDPLMTVRLPSALDNVSAELLLGAKPPKIH